MRELKNISILYSCNRIGKGSEKGNRKDIRTGGFTQGSRTTTQQRSRTGVSEHAETASSSDCP